MDSPGSYSFVAGIGGRLFPALLALLCLAMVSGPWMISVPAKASQATVADSDAGFESIFDGQTLKSWEGDPKYWRVENGAIVGEITPENLVKQNSFIIWRGGQTRDFELKMDYRISAGGNSGINYRSAELPDIKWALRGYQADLDGQNRNKAPLRHTGQNYEERGRTFIALRGQVTRLEAGKKPVLIGSVGDIQELVSALKSDDWNAIHIIARGSVMTHIINGRVMCVVVDDDAQNRRLDGLLGMQVHVGPPMKVEFRNIRIKKL